MDLSRSLHLPEDVVKKSSIINILGDHSILIENFKSIMDYKEDFVKIKAKNRIISIHGERLTIEYYNREEIKINGRMNSIFFEVLRD
ncbi:MAG: YabP/YqfC family sporulation protein [Alistipes sp.]|nr:YabP/YqfC family sporulation protein [Alistipes sp.]